MTWRRAGAGWSRSPSARLWSRRSAGLSWPSPSGAESSHAPAFWILTFLSGTGKNNPEQRATPLEAFQFDAPTVCLHRPASDGQTESRAAGLPRPGMIDTIEALEDPLVVRGGDAGAGVLHFDHRIAANGRCGSDTDHAVLRRVLDGVVEQIGDALAEDAGVTMRCHTAIELYGQVLVLLLGEHPETVRNGGDELTQIHGDASQRNTPGLRPREQQEILDQPCESIDLLEHAADDLTIALGTQRSLERDLSDTANGGERGAQLVRSVGCEAAELLEGRIEAR